MFVVGGKMTIQTKFNIGETLWFICDRKAITGKVSAIRCDFVEGDNHVSIKYRIIGNGELPECWVFKTKEELLKSL